MRPYAIEIRWVDYQPTIEDDMYEVKIWDNTHTFVVTSWQISGNSLGTSITKYMETSR